MNANKINEIISVWLDDTSDPKCPSWVVSRDQQDTETSDTLKYWGTEEHSDARDLAVAYGQEVAEKYRLPLVVEARPRD